MNLLRLSSLFVVPALAASFALACGELSDPTKDGEKTATVSGALTGTSVPAGAHVAIVWRNGSNGGVVVGTDVPIVNGKFTMTLTAPPDAYFQLANQDYDSLNGNNDTPRATEPSTPPSVGESSGTDPGGGTSSGGAKTSQKLTPRDTVSGGITEPLSVATAGFVVYVDANGNGKLDLEGEYASSPDTLIGGNKELLLTYLKGGGQLDFEKLRDKSGILPVAGFNLAWDQGRWLPLSLVELQLTDKAKLPTGVCGGSSATFDEGSAGGAGSTGNVAKPEPLPPPDPDTDAGAIGAGPAPTPTYPPAGDPGVNCYDNGHAFYYTGDCPKPPPPPVGLCASGYSEPVACAGASETFVGDTPPAGWPCTITGPSYQGSSTSSSSGSSGASGSSGSSGTPIDGGPAPDAGGS